MLIPGVAAPFSPATLIVVGPPAESRGRNAESKLGLNCRLQCFPCPMAPPRETVSRQPTHVLGPTADCSLCRTQATIAEVDRQALHDHGGYVIPAEFDVVRRAMLVDESGEPLTRWASDRFKGNQMICSNCDGFVDHADFVHALCSCCAHLRCEMGFVEDTTFRCGVGRVTCPNPTLHAERRDILLLPF